MKQEKRNDKLLLDTLHEVKGAEYPEFIGLSTTAQGETKSTPPRVYHSEQLTGLVDTNLPDKAKVVINAVMAESDDAFIVGGFIRGLFIDRPSPDIDVAVSLDADEIIKRISSIEGVTYEHQKTSRVELVTVSYEGIELDLVPFQGGANFDTNLAIDAWHRDATINAVYFSYRQKHFIDYFDGVKDLREQSLRAIYPQGLFYYDPAAAYRFMRGPQEFHIARDTSVAIESMETMLKYINPLRRYQELKKLFLYGHAQRSYLQLKQYMPLFMDMLWPLASMLIDRKDNTKFYEGAKFKDDFVQLCFEYIDIHYPELSEQQREQFLLAALLWYRGPSSKFKNFPQQGAESESFKDQAKSLLFAFYATVSFNLSNITGVVDIWVFACSLLRKPAKDLFVTSGQLADKDADAYSRNMVKFYRKVKPAFDTPAHATHKSGSFRGPVNKLH